MNSELVLHNIGSSLDKDDLGLVWLNAADLLNALGFNGNTAAETLLGLDLYRFLNDSDIEKLKTIQTG